MNTQADNRSPAELVAIARAANVIGDRDLERAAKQELLDRHGITIRFRRPPVSRGAAR